MAKEKVKMMRVGVLLNTADSDYAAAFEIGYRHFSQHLGINHE
jgi:hypothetical protein